MGTGAGITRIASSALLDHALASSYIANLVKLGLLSHNEVDGKIYYHITPRGTEFHATFDKLADMLNMKTMNSKGLGFLMGISICGLYVWLTNSEPSSAYGLFRWLLTSRV